MITNDYSLWKATKKLTGLLCRFPKSGKQMANGPGTMNKKLNDLLNTWSIHSKYRGNRKKTK